MSIQRRHSRYLPKTALAFKPRRDYVELNVVYMENAKNAEHLEQFVKENKYGIELISVKSLV